MAPIAIVVGIAVVAGLIAYLIWQQSQPASDSNTEAQAVEANASTDLPGEFVNLPEIYGNDSEDAAYGDSPNTAPHVTREVDYAEEQGLPPTGGPHWGEAGPCGDSPGTAAAFCGPVTLGFYRVAWDAGSLIHNMEHSGVVVWYNTIDEAIIDDLQDFAEGKRGRFLVVSFYPEMEAETVAITSWSRRLIMSVSEYDREMLDEFFDVHECRFDPEGFC